jgi:cytochrome b subunit of formate dehydrogenase
MDKEIFLRKYTLIKMIMTTLIIAVVVILGIGWANHTKIGLFTGFSWIMAFAVTLGFITGIVRGKVKLKNEWEYARTERHSVDSFLEHWGTGVGIVVLIYSGFRIFSGSGGMAGPNLHYVGLLLVLFFGSYFAAEFLLLKKHKTLLPTASDIIDGTVKKYFFHQVWPENGKYLSSQKAAFLVFAALGAEVVITGALKLAALFWNVPAAVLSISTLLHDISGLLALCMLLVHVSMVLIIRHHRHLLGAWFTGDVRGGLPWE